MWPLRNCIESPYEPFGGLLVYMLDNSMEIDPEMIKRSTEELLEYLTRVNIELLDNKDELIKIVENYKASMDVYPILPYNKNPLWE